MALTERELGEADAYHKLASEATAAGFAILLKGIPAGSTSTSSGAWASSPSASSAGHDIGRVVQGGSNGNEVEAETVATGPASAPASATPAPRPTRVTMNTRMIEAIDKRPESAGWSVTQWVEYLKKFRPTVGRATVQATRMWRHLRATHVVEKVIRSNDKRRRQKKVKKPNE